MTTSRDPDRLIHAFLREGDEQLDDRVYDAVRAEIEHQRQRVVIGPWRLPNMSNYARIAIAGVVVLVVAFAGVNLLPNLGGLGGPGSNPTASPAPSAAPTPTATPTAAPVASPTPVAVREGRLAAGSYVLHPFSPPNDRIAFTLTVPSGSWEAVDWRFEDGPMSGVAWSGDSGGVAAGFVRVDTLNEDPCNWSGTDDDVNVGPSVEDLVTALTRTKEGIEGANMRYKVSEPSEDISLGGYSGKQVVVTMPADYESQYQCDDGYLIWNAEGFEPDAMGPENRWTLSILDVEGERVVILMSDFEDSDPERVQELQSIVDSIVITAR